MLILYRKKCGSKIASLGNTQKEIKEKIHMTGKFQQCETLLGNLCHLKYITYFHM
jgi:hypothetical protein